MAWHDKSLYQLFNDAIFEDASSIFVTSSFLRLIQGNASSSSHVPLDFSPFLGKYLIDLCNWENGISVTKNLLQLTCSMS